jgi:hypothetical protein
MTGAHERPDEASHAAWEKKPTIPGPRRARRRPVASPVKGLSRISGRSGACKSEEMRIMKITLMDRSNYFRGLLLLIRKDRKTPQPEIDLMARIGKALGFEKEFCENAIAEILQNPYIVNEAPVFSTRALAVKFLKDGLSLALADGELHPREEQWLKSTMEKNGLDAKLFSEELADARTGKCGPDRLEADELTV